jgi:hypothetical protein
MGIDFTKTAESIENVIQDTPAPRSIAKKTKPPKRSIRIHTLATPIDADVWPALQMHKITKIESYTDAINNALRQYLGIKGTLK